MITTSSTNFEEFQSNPFQILARANKLAPRLPALVSAATSLTFSEFHTSAINLAAWLRAKGVRRGDVVAVYVQPELQPILTFSLFHEGATACFPGGNNKSLSKLGCRTLVTSDPNLQIKGLRSLVFNSSTFFTENWKTLKDFKMVDLSASDQTLRISFSSGSTGEPKAVPLSLRGILEKAYRAQSSNHFTPPILSTLGYSGGASLTVLLVNFYNFEPTLVSSNARETSKLLGRGIAKTLQTSPAQLRELYQHLSTGAVRPVGLSEVYCAGGRVAPDLARKFYEEFSIPVYSWFGASEVGSIAVNRDPLGLPRNLGTVLSGAEARVVDSNWLPTPVGTEGNLVLRTPGMATSYLGDSGATSLHFRDGWFLSGDRAMQCDDGSIDLLGRDSDLANAAGVKVDLQSLDYFALTHLPITDVASFIKSAEDGTDLLCLAFVSAEEPKIADFVKVFREGFSHGVPNILIKVQEIPRSETGKPLRKQLSRTITFKN